MIETLVLAGGLVPLAVMIVALFAASWVREARREPAPSGAERD